MLLCRLNEFTRKYRHENLPKHLAIIMDGNGRWAKQQGLLRALGHESGTKSVKIIIKRALN
jgi:undecaprenyl diphosphate synthase